VLARFGEYGFDGVLPKPFGIRELRRALDEAESSAIRTKTRDDGQAPPAPTVGRRIGSSVIV
jgi:hypothetical protein